MFNRIRCKIVICLIEYEVKWNMFNRIIDVKWNMFNRIRFINGICFLE